MVGFGEVISLAIIILPTLLLLGALNTPMILQEVIMYLMLFLGAVFWCLVGWTESKLIGGTLTFINIGLLILIIIAN